MKYKFEIRGIGDNEIDANCPFPLEKDDFEMYLNAFLDDIGNIPTAISVAREGVSIKIVIESNSKLEELKSGVKSVFQMDSGKCFRMASDLEED